MSRICVYCASSSGIDSRFHDAARELGALLARRGDSIIYGGGGRGSMGAVADGALAEGGQVIGVLPRFMADLEWGHPGLTRLDLVEDMRERKHRMLVDSDAVVALPGGCGTFEELFEALTLKRLGLYTGPIVLMNTLGYYDPMEAVLEQAVTMKFMADVHRQMWNLVDRPDQVPGAIESALQWTAEHRDHAVVPTSAHG